MPSGKSPANHLHFKNRVPLMPQPNTSQNSLNQKYHIASMIQISIFREITIIKNVVTP